jgi:hypothetical protein
LIVLFLSHNIPQIDAANSKIISDNESKLKNNNNSYSNAIFSKNQKPISLPIIRLSPVVSAGGGRGYFFPPRPVKKRFFCTVAIIFYSNIFSLTLINNRFHSGAHVLIFIGIARVWITNYFIIGDDIALIGVGFAKAIF